MTNTILCCCLNFCIILVTEVTTIVLSTEGCTACFLSWGLHHAVSVVVVLHYSFLFTTLRLDTTVCGCHYSLRYHYDVTTSYSQSKWCCHLIDNGNICYYVIMLLSCIPLLRCLSLSTGWSHSTQYSQCERS